jgi:IS30 family transposase
MRGIARALGVAASTISREIKRNRCHATDGAYRPSKAQERTNGRRRRSRQVRHHAPAVYEWLEAQLLDKQWSPEQIADRAREALGVRISAMTIYRYVRGLQRQGDAALATQLRHGRKRRRKRTFGAEKRGKLQGKPMIDTRPPAVELRQEIGHWEGDTVMGCAGERSCLLTIVERSSGWGVVVRLPNRTVQALNRAAIAAIRGSGLPFKTITWDNGTEFHGYRALEQATGVKCYFAYPHRPWERGSNENFNGLLRQYFPKRKSLSRIRQADCDAAAAKLNQRPRKRYGFQTPEQRLKQSGVLHLGC